MTGWTIGSEIIKPICFFPIAIKVSPRYNMVDIHWPIKLFFGDIAILTSIIISLSSPIFLLLPVGTTPFFMTTLPIAMIFSLLPIGSTLIRAKSACISITFYNMCLNLNRFSTLFTSQDTMTAIITTFLRAGISPKRFFSIAICPKLFTANLTRLESSGFFAFICTVIRTKTIFSTFLVWKCFTTYLTDLGWIFQGFAIAFMRTISLGRAMWSKILFTYFTFELCFHTSIIPQPRI